MMYKRVNIMTTIIILIILSLSACEFDTQISKNDINNTAETNVSVTKEQSNVPYLGDEEITPLFIGRNNISDWIKDIKVSDVNYIFYKDGTTGMTILDVRSSSIPGYDKTIASFYIEENVYADFRTDKEDCIFKTLSNEIMDLKIIEVIYLDFDNMGIYFNLRGIVKGSSVDDVKRAFLNMNYEIDYTGVTHQKLYNNKDVYPNVKINPRYEDYMFIGGEDSLTMEQQGFRVITYRHTNFYDSENVNYASRYKHSSIYFSIDTNDGKVEGLTYEKTEGLTDEKVMLD